MIYSCITYNLFYYIWIQLGGKTTTRSRGGGGTRQILMTDELREELAQAAAATSHAYAVGARNLSVASLTNSADGV